MALLLHIFHPNKAVKKLPHTPTPLGSKNPPCRLQDVISLVTQKHGILSSLFTIPSISLFVFCYQLLKTMLFKAP